MSTDGDSVKIRFSLTPDDTGWPPVGSEGIWAMPLGGGRYRIDNNPWFVRGLACGDIVEGEEGSDGVIWATELVAWSGHLTIRVIPLAAGPLAGDLQRVIDAFAPLGLSCEGAEPAYRIVALDVPPDAPLADIKALLREGRADGRWDYEEGCVSEAWQDL